MNLKSCCRCKLEKDRSQYYKTKLAPDGLNWTCKACVKIQRAAHYKTNKASVKASNKEYSKTVKGRFARLKASANNRNLPVEITLEQYGSLIQNPCYYSGHPLPEGGGGLDRIDSSKGYAWDNVIPCCQVCNIMKNTLSEREWYDHMKLILSRNSFI